MSEHCERCAVLEDLLETATSERDKARDESRKADDETLELKRTNIGIVARDMTDAYRVIKQFERRAEEAEAKLIALSKKRGKP
jgi:hypothetical protein